MTGRTNQLTHSTACSIFLQMFTVAFPLAPVIALIVSLLDLRFDAHRLLWFNRRPVAHMASDIGRNEFTFHYSPLFTMLLCVSGTWQPILQFINFCGVITNSFLVVSASGATKNYSLITKLFIMLAFEHMLFFLMYICQVVIPDVPARIKEATRRVRRIFSVAFIESNTKFVLKEKYQVNKILAEGYIPSMKEPVSSSSPVTRVSSVTSVTNFKKENNDMQMRNIDGHKRQNSAKFVKSVGLS